MRPPIRIESVRAMAEECTSGRPHVQGDLDWRIVAFYEELIREYPDFPPYADPSPWMDLPLGTGIDHIAMHVSYSACGIRATARIIDLAEMHDLVFYDHQLGTARVPSL